jgi:hypothetical protein
MIIWGSKAKVQNVGGGSFFCPSCKGQTNYARQRVSRYFTLYFIPLFPTKTLGEYIRCGTCQTEMRPEVLTLTREQIEHATAPWTCTACGNRNSASEKACLSCGTARKQEPPPLPGQAAPAATPLPASVPPLPSSGSGKQRSGLGKVLVILAWIVGSYVVLTAGLHLLVYLVKKHPHHSVIIAGQQEFEAASKTIADNHEGAAHGNTPRARELATSLAEALDEAYKKAFAGVPLDVDGTGGKFLVYCQEHDDACVFLVHVPNLRHFPADAQRSIADASYLEGCLVLKANGATGIRHVAVATRGALLYDTALLGSYPPQTPAPRDHLLKLTTAAWDVPDLYPYFLSKADGEKELPDAPATPTASATPATPVTPAAQAAPATTPAPAAPAPAETPAPPPATPTAIALPPSPPAQPAPSEAPVAPAAPVHARPPREANAAPSWVPIYPNLLRPALQTRRENNGVTKGMATCGTADPLNKVKEFYENRLKADGFEITTDKPTTGIFPGAEISGSRDEGRRTLRIVIHQMKTVTNAVLTYSSAETPAPAP